MARFIQNSRKQGLFLTIDLNKQLIPGTLEYTIDEIVEHKLNLSNLVLEFNNDNAGASAYNPKDLLKVLFLAYLRGICSSRDIERLCRENIIFITLSGDLHPDHSTIARFVQKLEKYIQPLFNQLLFYCEELELLAGTELAIDGCKIPSNAAKESSGTLSELSDKRNKYEKVLSNMMKKTKDTKSPEMDKRIEKHRKRICRIDDFINSHEKRIGSRNREVKSNITDNESAKLTSGHGVLQGYNALAAVDSKHQIITSTIAVGTQGEGRYLTKLIEKSKEALPGCITKETTILADTGYFSEENCKYLFKSNQTAVIPDNHFRQRDPRFHRSKDSKNINTRNKKSRRLYGHDKFTFIAEKNWFSCPAGKFLRPDGRKNMHGHIGRTYKNKDGDCELCHLKSECLQKNSKRRAVFIVDKPKEMTYSQKMMGIIDRPEGRETYSKRMGIVEPVFGNITYNKRLNRINYRGKKMVNTVWALYCLVHNIEKIHNYGIKN
jgi:transposase